MNFDVNFHMDGAFDAEMGEFTRGPKGADGVSPHIGENGNWYLGEEDTGVKAQGPEGSVSQESIENALGYPPSKTPDWEQNDETAKDFIKNRPAVISPEVEIFNQLVSSGGTSWKISTPIEEGQTYLFSSPKYGYNDVEKIATRFDETTLQIVLENGSSFLGGSFLYDTEKGTLTYQGSNFDRTIRLVKPAKQVIDPSKIPDMYYSEEVEKYISTGTGSDGFSDGGSYSFLNNKIIPRVVVHGETYENVPITYLDGSALPRFYIGPYLLSWSLGSGLNVVSGDVERTDFEFFKKEKVEKVHKVPEKYLPDTDNPPFIVTITGTTTGSNTTYSADHTFEEIMAAIEAGQNVYAMFDGKVPIVYIYSDAVEFGSNEKSPFGTSYNLLITITSDDAVSVLEMTTGDVPEPTKENAGKYLKVVGSENEDYSWSAEDAPGGSSGDSDISLGLTSATVGQIAKISAVDANGKPTAWETIDGYTGQVTAEKLTNPDHATDLVQYAAFQAAVPMVQQMNITGATVGQIIKVKAVDSSGHPTQWEAVDMPSGGGTWTQHTDMTVAEDVSYVQIDGLPEDWKELYILIGQGSKPVYRKTTDDSEQSYMLMAGKAANYNSGYSSWYMYLAKGIKWCHVVKPDDKHFCAVSSSYVVNGNSGFTAAASSAKTAGLELVDPTSVTMFSWGITADCVVSAGTTIKIWYLK